MPTHPDADELAAFSCGRLDEGAISEIEAHLAVCPICRAALKALPPDRLTALLQEPPVGKASAVGNSVPDLPAGLADHPRYRVLATLGAGGMGVVYKAEHRLMKRIVALKVIGTRLASSPAAVARFRREVESLAKLAHPDIAAAFDAEEIGGRLVLVKEYVAGADLAQVVRERGPIPTAQACAWVRQAALAIQHAHERGLVHRDIKPANLMRTTAGQIKVLDFGLASLHGEIELAPPPETPAPASQLLTDFGQGVGTAEFAAPEQVRDSHTADARSDIYALGATLVFLLTGRPPVRDGNGERAPDTNLPRPLVGVVERMTAADPERRFRTMAEVADALTPFIDGGRGWSRRGVLVAAGLALGGGAVAVPLIHRAIRRNGSGTGRCLWFRRPTDTISVHGGTVVSTAATYEARVLFPANGGSYGAVFNEWIDDKVDQYIGAGPDKVDAALFPFGWTGHNQPLARDVWHHVAWVYDGEELRLYLDGARVAAVPPKRDRGDRIGVGTTVASIGAVWRPPEELPRAGFVGYLDALRVSNVARYVGERFDPPQGKLPTDANTLLLFNFNDQPGSGTVTDESGHGRTGTFGIGFNGATRPEIEERP